MTTQTEPSKKFIQHLYKSCSFPNKHILNSCELLFYYSNIYFTFIIDRQEYVPRMSCEPVYTYSVSLSCSSTTADIGSVE